MKIHIPQHLDFVVTIALLAGCNRTAPEAKPQTEPPAPQATAPQAAAASGAAAASLDGRKPLPLTAMMANHQLQEMRDHLQVVQEIAMALGQGPDAPACIVGAGRQDGSDRTEHRVGFAA